MSKRITAIILFLSVFALQDAMAQVKIGYTNPARVLSQLPEVEEVDEQINTLIDQRDEELAAKATDLQQIFSNYESSMANLSQQERAVKEQELMEMNQEFEQDRETMMNEIRQKRNELMAPIIEKMNAAMEEVAQEMNLDLVLNEGTSYGDAIIFFAENEGLDITDKIIAKLN
ncbi:OmpH family outer membrane protein [Gracilimonas sp.]|uniref:OmpH family outer membrane protein n=1 Tax=Gracilimonas sp. TaxID=1974203 RepID=UPI003D0C8212